MPDTKDIHIIVNAMWVSIDLENFLQSKVLCLVGGYFNHVNLRMILSLEEYLDG
jgi:hypothetical protein